MNVEKALSFIVCPLCKGDLQYEKSKEMLICMHDKLTFPIKDEIIDLNIYDDIESVCL